MVCVSRRFSFALLLTGLSVSCLMLTSGCVPSTGTTTPPPATTGGTPASISASTDDVPPSEPPRIELEVAADDQVLRVVLKGLDKGSLNVCRKLSEDELNEAFAVYVDGDSADLPPLLGECVVDGDKLVFEPRYPPRPGLRLRALWDPEKIPCGGPTKVEALFDRPAPPPTPVASLKAIYPSRSVLPENQLKFYLHFSAPMSRGEAYAKVHLLDEQGREIERPFLELGEELWDPTGTRFTLYFDPGRIKRGLQPRELFGPSLVEGGRYTLVVDDNWLDAKGAPLIVGGKKQFSVVAPDETQPDPQRWKLTPPEVGSRQPLIVEFDEPLDRALLERVLIVQTTNGSAVAGEVSVDSGETRWRFIPAQAWTAGSYQLVVETILEDLAGNSIGRPFEVEIREDKLSTEAPATVTLPFEVAAAAPASP